MRKILLITLIFLATILPVSAEQFKVHRHGRCLLLSERWCYRRNRQGSLRSEVRDPHIGVLTSKPIAKALVDAKTRGVKVVVVLDKSQRREQYTFADLVAHN